MLVLVIGADSAMKGECNDLSTLMQTHLGVFSAQDKISCVGVALKDYKNGLLQKLNKKKKMQWGRTPAPLVACKNKS
jgi:hypothetical protein